ncbi:hypothetical protein [Williamsia sp. R60]
MTTTHKPPSTGAPRQSRSTPTLFVVGSLILFALAMFVLPAALGDDPYTNKPELVPGSVEDPPATWVFNFLIPILGTVVFIALTVQSVKRRSLSWYWLFFVAGVATFWVETIADWGIYLTYSPEFAHYELPFDYPWHVHDNPIFMPFAYGLYWGMFPYVVLRVHNYFSTRFGWSDLKGLVLIGVPFGIVWDLLVEGTATYFGWWTYEPPLGPSFSWVPLGGIGIQTIVVPVLLMIVWPNLVAWMAGDPDDGSSPRIAALFRIPAHRYRDDALRSGQRVSLALPAAAPRWDFPYEFMRLGAWISVFWWAQVTQIVPIIIVRYVFGGDSVYAPFPAWF